MSSPSRRELLRALAASPLTACTPSLSEESCPSGDAPQRTWAGVAEVDESLFWRGVQTGDPSEDGFVVSLRVDITEALELILAEAQEDGSWTELDRISLTPSDGGLQHTLTGLRPDQLYAMTFLTSASTQSPVAYARTALSSTQWRTLRFGATSCMEGNQPWPSLSQAAAQELDAFFLLGDTVYADEAFDQEGYRAYWDEALGTQGLRELALSTALVATWDDHEVGNNWSLEDEGIEERLALAQQAFSEALPRRPGGGSQGIWRRLSWGQVAEVIVLDCRSERSGGRYLSEEQMDFLKTSLRDSQACFKLILNSVPITDYEDLLGDYEEEDRWSGYPEEREEILRFLQDEGITGVLWIGGDFHAGQLGRVDPAGGLGEALYEVLVGPAGSNVNPVALLEGVIDDIPHHQQLVGAWNVVILTLDPCELTLRVCFLGDDGELLLDELLSF